MPINLSYVTRETSSNLWRNVTLTVASMLTVAVSLSLVGAALLLRDSVDNATARWKGGIEFIVFMKPDAQPEQIQSMESVIDASPEVASFEYFDHDRAFEEFEDLFADSPEVIESVAPTDLPTSFRVVPTGSDAEVIDQLGQQFETRPGVREVVFAFETVKTMQRFSGGISIGMLVIAIVLLTASTLLIINTIRIAMFARRREIEVMKLVGATNWFIRIPFMLEGLVQGLIGAIGAIVMVRIGSILISNRLDQADDLRLLRTFAIDNGAVWTTSLILLGVGALAGMIGSGVAVTRFLDV